MAVCVGCGLNIDGDGLLEVERRPGGGILCQNTGAADDGLYVDVGALGITTSDTSTIDMSGNGTGGNPIRGDVRVSAANCNSISVNADGLYIACQDGVTGIQEAFNTVNPVVMPLAVVGPENTYTWTSGQIVITNNLCHEVRGTIDIRGGGLYLDAANTFYGEAHLRVNPGGTGMVPAFPNTGIVFENKSGSNLHTSFNNFVDENLLVIPANSAVTYQAAIVLLVHTGSGTVSTIGGGVGWEFNWTLVHVNNCDHV